MKNFRNVQKTRLHIPNGKQHFFVSSGFTIIELMVAILVFTLGMLSAYMLVDTAMSAAINGRNEITAANLAREQIELLKNFRDTNWLQNLNFMSTSASDNFDIQPVGLTEFSTGYYLIENRSGVSGSPTIFIKKLSGFHWVQDEKDMVNLEPSQLCLKDGKYTHICDSNDKKLQMYSFIKIEPLVLNSSPGNIPNAFRISSVVVSTQRGYREYVIRTIITDWKR